MYEGSRHIIKTFLSKYEQTGDNLAVVARFLFAKRFTKS